MANAHEFISKFPEKYKTVVGERGVRLSGELLMNPKVLLLDEAHWTPNLNISFRYIHEFTRAFLQIPQQHVMTVSEQDAMESLMKGRTVIAHRLSTVKSVADVSDGQIVECGTHHHLLDKNGIYTALVKRQLQQGPKFEDGHQSVKDDVHSGNS